MRHGPADVAGRCPWCGTKVTNSLPAPRSYPRSDLTEAYGYVYDPDEGARGVIEIKRLIESGQDSY